MDLPLWECENMDCTRDYAEHHAAHSLTVTAKILKGGTPTVFGES